MAPLFIRIKVPRSIAMVITTLQLLQMVVGCIVNYSAYTFKLKGKCNKFSKNFIGNNLSRYEMWCK